MVQRLIVTDIQPLEHSEDDSRRNHVYVGHEISKILANHNILKETVPDFKMKHDKKRFRNGASAERP